MPSFLEIVRLARATLQENGRVSLRALRREFELDDEALEDLIEELVDVQQVADRDGRVLSWRGSPAPTSPGREAVGADAEAPAAPPVPTATPPPEPPPSAPAPLELESGERRQLTVMFCDLVGSTELAERVDPEELRQIVHEYRAVCVEATKRFEGHVAQYLGDGVLVYFGYPVAHEDAASRAIRAGLEIQRELAERPEIQRIGARIGIHTGLVVVDDEALALGSTTNLAARIEAAAEPGTVVVSEATLALCRGAFLSRELGPQRIKGFDEPVVLHRIDALVRLRSADAQASSRPMVGRDRELGLVLDRWEEAREGYGQVVLVSGEPGVGKSRLIQALQHELGESPHLWLDLRCSPYAQSSAFQPLVELFATGVGQDDTSAPEERSRRLVAGLEALPGVHGEKVVPYLLALLSLPASERHPLPETSAEERRERTFSALVELMIRLSERQPVVLVAEDLQWCDPSTLEYIGRIVAQAPTLRVLVVPTFRPEFDPPWSQSHVSEVKLGRLSQRATRELIENAVGGKLPEPILSELEGRSDGVPLFMEELATSVVSSGVLAKQAGGFELRGGLKDLAIPATLQDSLMARLDRLSASKHVAQQAATLGREFPYELIEAVTELDAPALRTALDQLVEAEILHRRGTPPDATYTFKHALLQDTAYESQLRSNRRALHARAAAVLEERFPQRVQAEPERMARHCEAAGDHTRAVGHFERAADLALARVSNQEAATHYASALASLTALPENGERRQREVSLRLAHWRALVALHGFDPASEVLERLEALADQMEEGPEQIPALLGLATSELFAGNFSKSHEHVERLFPIVEPLDVPLLLSSLYFIRGVIAELTTSSTDAVRLVTHALEIVQDVEVPAPAPNDQDLITNSCSTLSIAQANAGLCEASMRSLEASRRRVLELGSDFVTTSTFGAHGVQAFLLPDPELGRSLGDEALARAEGRGFHAGELMARASRGWGRAMLGETEAGVRDVERAIEIHEQQGARGGVSMVFVMTAEVYRLAGDRERSEAFLDRADRYATRYDERAILIVSAWKRALLCLDLGSGDPNEAEPLLLQAYDQAAATGRLNLEIQIGTDLARLAPRTGKVREAHDRLAAAIARLTEGHERDVVREARRAVEELKAQLD